MSVLLVLLTLADLALGVLLIAVSGYILQGVNNTGPLPGSVWFVLFVILCFAAPAIAWGIRGAAGPGWALAVAAVPAVIGLVMLAISPTS